MVITLIGYRGTGKSTVARALGERLGWTSVDADDEIECLAKMSIQQIFAERGESAFRGLERITMARLLSGHDRLIIAAGGGAILNQQTRSDIKAAGPVVWLRASTETILARMRSDATTTERRPNLTPAGGRHEVEELLARREPLYREAASVIVDTEGRTVEAIVEEIVATLEPRRQEGAAG
jgi:shikimate kinase